MNARSMLLNVMSLLAITAVVACDRSSGLKGQKNTTLEFYGLVVDQDGKPLADAQIQYQVDAYPKDWTFDTRGRPYDTSRVGVTSDARGRFQFAVTGCILRRLKAEKGGYRHFYEEDSGKYSDHTDVCTSGFRLIAWGDPNYKSDSDHPAVFVFVKVGVHEVSALPCKGGYDSANGNGTQWRLNKPGWPRKPSLNDVVQKRSSMGTETGDTGAY